MFTTLIVQPIFNVLAFIYAIVPGHNFGLSLVLFTALSRLALWPLLKKQLHQAKAMRELQPELKKIKQATKGDKQKESAMTMELYRERGINPFGQIGLLILQLPLFIALYSGINKIVADPNEIINFSYSFIRDLGWMKDLAGDISKFDMSFLGVVDLHRAALGAQGVYIPGLIIVLSSAILQYFVSKQLMPDTGEAKGLKSILKEANTGKMAEQSDVNAAVSRNMLYLTPLLIAFITIRIPAALALYLLAGSVVAFFQQRSILQTDQVELEAIADGESTEAVLLEKPGKPPKTKSKKSSNRKKKRR